MLGRKLDDANDALALAQILYRSIANSMGHIDSSITRINADIVALELHLVRHKTNAPDLTLEALKRRRENLEHSRATLLRRSQEVETELRQAKGQLQAIENLLRRISSDGPSDDSESTIPGPVT